MSVSSDDEEEVGLLVVAKETALKPIRYATSKSAQRAYITSLLSLIAALFLLGTAVTAYALFYFSYIPLRGFSQPVYLQFDQGRHPYASIELRPGHLVSDQPYDVKAHLHLPRTPINIAAGNFMIDLQLIGPPGTGWTEESQTLVRERRPAILTYRSNILEHVHNAIALPFYVLGWRKEAENLIVPLLDGTVFARGRRNVPSTAKVEIQGAAHLQVYDMRIEFRTRLRGLRYLMYNHRIISFVFFTSTFWLTEMVIAVSLWFSLTVLVSSRKNATDQALSGSVKLEEESAAGTAATQLEPSPPASPGVKKEERLEPPLDAYPAATEADVEDEEDEDPGVIVDMRHGPSDSGIGTSMESSAARREVIRRRSSKTLKEER